MQQKPMGVMIAIGVIALLGVFVPAVVEHWLTTPERPAFEYHRHIMTMEELKQILSTRPATIPNTTQEALPGTEEATRAMINFGMTLSADEIIFGSWWSGIAESRKAGAYLKGTGVFVQLPDNGNWPIAVQGLRVVVVGRTVVRHDLPVFHVSKEPLPKGVAYAAGIPVPEGTDLYKATERTIIEEVQWCLVPDKEPTKSN